MIVCILWRCAHNKLSSTTLRVNPPTTFVHTRLRPSSPEKRAGVRGLELPTIVTSVQTCCGSAEDINHKGIPVIVVITRQQHHASVEMFTLLYPIERLVVDDHAVFLCSFQDLLYPQFVQRLVDLVVSGTGTEKNHLPEVKSASWAFFLSVWYQC
jgi:hypothetical protein